MGGATVIILVQSTVILLALSGGGIGWWCAWKFFNAAKSLKLSNESLRESCDKFLTQITEYSDANDRLRAKLSDFSLAPKPKKTDDPVIHATSSAQVRQLTEQAWGPKPGDKDEPAVN